MKKIKEEALQPLLETGCHTCYMQPESKHWKSYLKYSLQHLLHCKNAFHSHKTLSNSYNYYNTLAIKFNRSQSLAEWAIC